MKYIKILITTTAICTEEGGCSVNSLRIASECLTRLHKNLLRHKFNTGRTNYLSLFRISLTAERMLSFVNVL
jgi:hypothetical protein